MASHQCAGWRALPPSFCPSPTSTPGSPNKCWQSTQRLHGVCSLRGSGCIESVIPDPSKAPGMQGDALSISPRSQPQLGHSGPTQAYVCVRLTARGRDGQHFADPLPGALCVSQPGNRRKQAKFICCLVKLSLWHANPTS